MVISSTKSNGCAGKASESEIWSSKNNSCVACQIVCITEEEKRAHEKLALHIKKFNIYTFFSKESANLASSDKPSSLLKRYQMMNEKAIGLECIHELQFPWCATGWWACSICYESGCHYEQADHHIRSKTHLTTYLEEFHPQKAEHLLKTEDQTKQYEQLLKMRNDLFNQDQNKKLLAPEVLSISLTKEQAMAKLVVTEPVVNRTIHVHPLSTDTSKRMLLQCGICHDVIPCLKKNAIKAWSIHEGTPHHKNCVAIGNVVEQLGTLEVIDNEMSSSDSSNYTWKEVNGTFFGPVCGISQLLSCGRENYCQLCCCKVESIEEHFSSENHIMKFLSTKQCVKINKIWQQNGCVRREAMLTILKEVTLDNNKSRKMNLDAIPPIILEYSGEEELYVREFMPPLMTLGFDANCLVCEDCCLAVKIEKGLPDGGASLWDEHVTSAAHFDYMARRSSFRYYDEFFIPVMSSIKPAKSCLNGEWKDITVDENTSYRVQTQCDIGLEWIVEDLENEEVVCTLCARIYKRGAHENISNHVRSYMHLNQYLNMHNRELLAMLMMQTSEKAVQDLMLEWLQRNAKMSQSPVFDPMFMEASAFRDNWSQAKVYSADRALALGAMSTVPSRTVSLAYCEPKMRPLIATIAPVIDAIAEDGVEKECMDLREALYLSSCRILHMDNEDAPTKTSRVLLRCMTCQLVFTTKFETLAHDVWDGHLNSSQHDARVAAIEASKLDMYGFAEATSTYTVKPFVQRDPAKKVTWQWNAKDKLHDFVLSVIGLEDLVERRTLGMGGDQDHTPDFFCRLCAVTIPKRAAMLDAHVRSAAHVLCYVHKYHPMTVLEINSLQNDDNGKMMRRILAQLLKDTVPSSEYCIPVYDPVGEIERKGVVAMQRAVEAERNKANEELRRKAREQRMLRDEERRKIREKELQREQQRKEEREKREKEAQERAQKLEEERARLRQKAIDTAKKLEEQKLEAAAEEAARREKERANLQQILNCEKARLKMLQDRDKAMKLVQEKVGLEQKMKLLQQKAELMKQKQQNQAFVVVPEPQLVIPTKLMEGRSAMSSFAAQRQSRFDSPVSSAYSQPPPSMGQQSFDTPYGVPPPVIRETLQKIGPKPTFSSFVPQADVMPVYPTKDADEDVEMDQSRSPTPNKKSSRRHRTRSPSDRKSRKKKKKRSRSNSAEKWNPIEQVPARPDGYRPSLQGREVDPYVSNPAIITSRSALVDFIWRQGAERIPDCELPEEFNKKAVGVEGNVGVDSLYEVVCIDCPELDTFYCSMCGVWTTPSDMFRHLGTPEHKLSYLFRNYKMYHQTIMSETNSIVKASMLTQFALQIWKMEQPPAKVSNRLRAVLDRATIFRCWPEHIHLLDHSWKQEPVGRVHVPAPVSKEAMGGFLADADDNKQEAPATPVDDSKNVSEQKVAKEDVEEVEIIPKDSKKEKRKRSESPKRRKRSTSRESRDGKKRKRSATPDKRRRSRSRSREKSRRDRRSRSRDRKRSRSRDRKRSRSRDRKRRSRSRDRKDSSRRSPSRKNPKDDVSWMETAAAFLEKLGDHTAAEKVRAEHGKKKVPSPRRSRSRSPSQKKRERTPSRSSSDANKDFNARLAQIRNLANPAPVKPPAPECIVLEDEVKSTPKVAPADPKAEMRKLLGVLITMQQEAEKTGVLDASVVDKLYREVGLQKKKGMSNDQLLAELCTELAGEVQPSGHKTIDLGAFGITSAGPSSTSTAPPQQHHSVQHRPGQQQTMTPTSQQNQFAPQQNYYNQPPPAHRSNTNPELEKILSGISGSLSALKNNRPQSPIMKSNRAYSARAEDVFTDDSISYVYPDLDSDGKEVVTPPVAKQQTTRPVSSFAPSPQMNTSQMNTPQQQRFGGPTHASPAQSVASSHGSQQTPTSNSNQKKAPSRKQLLLEQAERLRKEAEAANDDDGEDDWDSLESEMTQVLSGGPTPAKDSRSHTKIGVPTKWAQPVPQQRKDAPTQPAATVSSPLVTQQAVPTTTSTPIAPGQRMALARTMLPNGKLPPGYVQPLMQPVVSKPKAVVSDDDIQIISTSAATSKSSTKTSQPATVSSVAAAANPWAVVPPGLATATAPQLYPVSSVQQGVSAQPNPYAYQQPSQQQVVYPAQQQQMYQPPQQQVYQPAYVHPGQPAYQQPPPVYPQQPGLQQPQQYYNPQQPYYGHQQYGGGY